MPRKTFISTFVCERNGYVAYVTEREVGERLLTITQVAEYCNVSKRLVQGWLYSGELAAIRLAGKTIRIRQSALDEFLDRPYDPQEVKEARRRTAT